MKYFYVYRISNKVLNKHYYGSRTSSIHPYKDLGKKYFSSSTDKEFKKLQKQNPEIFKYKIIKIFSSQEEMYNYEIRLHDKFLVSENDRFYNLQNQRKNGFTTSGNSLYKWADNRNDERIYCSTSDERVLSKELIHFRKNIPQSKEHTNKLRITRVGRIASSEAKQNMSIAGKGKKKPKGFGDKISKALKNKPKSEQHKRKLSEANKGNILSEETRNKLSILKRGKNNPSFIGWYITPKGKFDSINDAAKENNISTYKIRCRCKDSNKIDKETGLTWKEHGYSFEPYTM